MSGDTSLKSTGFVKLFAGSTLNYVSFAVALGPLLGSVDVPVLRVLVALMPFQLKDTLITFSFFLAPLVAVVIKFYSLKKRARRELTKRFVASLAALLISFSVLVGLYWRFVVKVPVRHASHSVAVLVGLHRSLDCCPDKPGRKLRDAECVKEISLDETRLDSCWDFLWLIKMAFTASYLVAINGFIGVVGFLMLIDEDQKRNKKSAKRAVPRRRGAAQATLPRPGEAGVASTKPAAVASPNEAPAVEEEAED